MPLPATVTVPDFLLCHGRELKTTLNDLCDSTCTHLLMLIICHSDFKTGWFLGSYARLQALSTPPKPEQGRRRDGPTLKEIRSALERLIAAGVVWRDASNLHNKQLRLRVWPRDVKAASAEITGSISGREEKRAYRASMRAPRGSRVELGQKIGQGYQQLNSIPPTPTKTGGYPQASAAKTEAMAKIGDLLRGFNRPPEGGSTKGADAPAPPAARRRAA